MRSVTPSSQSSDPFEQLRADIEQILHVVGGSRLGARAGQGQGSGISSSIIGLIPPASVPTDIIETQEQYQVVLEIPGLQQSDINVTVSGDTLTVSGYKQYQQQYIQQLQQQGVSGQQTGSQQQQTGQGGQGQQHPVLIERGYGQFTRQFQLPQNIDRDNIRADYSRGVLTLMVPKSQEAQRQQKRIEVKASNA